MDQQHLRIVSDGTAVGTKVYLPSGEEVKGITGITIEPLRPGEPVRASLSFMCVKLDMQAEQVAPGYEAVSVDVTNPNAMFRRLPTYTDAIAVDGCKATVARYG
jgi:hypothetical protein